MSPLNKNNSLKNLIDLKRQIYEHTYYSPEIFCSLNLQSSCPSGEFLVAYGLVSNGRHPVTHGPIIARMLYDNDATQPCLRHFDRAGREQS